MRHLRPGSGQRRASALAVALLSGSADRPRSRAGPGRAATRLEAEGEDEDALHHVHQRLDGAAVEVLFGVAALRRKRAHAEGSAKGLQGCISHTCQGALQHGHGARARRAAKERACALDRSRLRARTYVCLRAAGRLGCAAREYVTRTSAACSSSVMIRGALTTLETTQRNAGRGARALRLITWSPARVNPTNASWRVPGAVLRRVAPPTAAAPQRGAPGPLPWGRWRAR